MLFYSWCYITSTMNIYDNFLDPFCHFDIKHTVRRSSFVFVLNKNLILLVENRN